jgi:hypothetical protein
VPEATLAPLRVQIVNGLDRIYGMVTVASRTAFNFGGAVPRANLTELVLGPDGAPYVLDKGTSTVYRIDLVTRKAAAILKNGQTVGTTKASAPKMLAVGGPDVLILDTKNALWRWTPADDRGEGTLARVNVSGSTSWGTDIKAIGTYVRSTEQGLYNLYVVDPSEKQILRYSPAADGSGYPAAPSGFLATAQAVADVESMYIDGDIYVAANGVLKRFMGGQAGNWSADNPGDELLRAAPAFVDVTSPGDRGAGLLYAYDKTNSRIVSFDKASGEFREQYRVTITPGWRDLRGMYVTPGTDGDPATITWMDSKRLYTSVLQPVAAPAASGATARPTRTPASATESAAVP